MFGDPDASVGKAAESPKVKGGGGLFSDKEEEDVVEDDIFGSSTAR